MPESLTLIDFSDVDLYYAWEDAKDDDGWATSAEVAEQTGVTADKPAKYVGARFAWWKRYGWFENKSEKGETLWRPTKKGRELFNPRKIAVATARALNGLDEGQRAQVTADLARTLPAGSREGAHLASRAWRSGLQGWRDPKLANKS
jgi:hypothetical protein